MNRYLLLTIIFISVLITAKAQQATGQFILTDGGFEGQPYASFSNQATANKPTSLWSRNTLSKCANIHGVYKLGKRSGNYYMAMNDTMTTNITNYSISPALASGAVVGGKTYFLQCYYRAKDSINLPNTQISVGLSNASGTNAKMSNFVFNSNPNNAIWLKSVTQVTAASATTPGNGFILFSIAGGAGNNKKTLAIDDVVLYSDTAIDTIPPSPAGAVSVYAPTKSTLMVKWGASPDVDGGGYLVVKYKQNPDSTNQYDPNVNGIYSAGNVIDSGVVDYVGTATSYTSMLLDSNTTYYYRVYVVDKAFNYSPSSMDSGMTNNGAVIPVYYIDSIAGNDMNDGHTPATAWQTIAKVNATNFSPGDSILFKSGCTWSGIQLHPLGAGLPGQPITISKYGSGNLPLINGNTATAHNQYAVYLYNQEYWTISNLEITNNYQSTAKAKDTSITMGVYVLATNYGVVHGITLKNLYIHHVLGAFNKNVYSGGIFCNINGTSTPTLYDSLLIDSCIVKNCDLTGISNESSWTPLRSITNDSGFVPSTNVIIQNCTLDSIGGNSLVLRAAKNPMIQYNKVWKSGIRYTGNSIFFFNCDDGVMQHNESAFNKFNTGDHDASGFDGDYRCHRTVIQYNYSHDNDGGAFVVVCDPNYANSFNDSAVIRYNISQNDSHAAGGKESAIFRIDGLVSNVTCYNNSIYTSTDIVSAVYHCAWGGGTSGTLPKTTKYYNNIFYLNKKSTPFAVNSSTGNVFSNNTYFYSGTLTGTHPTDANALTTDPKFVSAGSGGVNQNSTNSVDGYKLQASSLCINSGMLLTNHSPLDYWGNPVPGTAGKAPCRGAFEYSATLSVSLLDFKGASLINANQLTWTTTEEINNAGFEIQRSIDGIIFDKVSFVPSTSASGNTVGAVHYTYTDNTPFASKNYYRLKQIDKGGQATFSNIILLVNNIVKTPSIAVYPNPLVNGNSLNLSFNNIPKGVYQLNIVDLQGKSVYSKMIEHSGNNTSMLIQLENKPAKGLYSVSVQNESFKKSIQLIIN